MDFLPVFDGPQGRLFSTVPHVAHVRYDRAGFDGYLERIGTNERSLLGVPLGAPSEVLMVSIIQEWLFFGLLHEFGEILGLPPDLNAFIVAAGAERRYPRLTLSPLPAFLRDLVLHRARAQLGFTDETLAATQGSVPLTLVAAFSLVQEDAAELDRERKRLCACLSRASAFLFNLLEACPEVAEGMPGQSTARRLNVILFISCFIKALIQIARCVLEKLGQDILPGPWLGNLFQAHMARAGWCPSQVESILYLDSSELFAACTMPSFDHRSHSKCSDIKCLEPAGPPTVHVSSCDGHCPLVEAGERWLNEILARDSFPVLQCRVTGDKTQLEVVDRNTVTEYVAISHVWCVSLPVGVPDCAMKYLPS